MEYDLSYPGAQYRDELVAEVSEPMPQRTPTTVKRQLDNMRRLWVLDQYLKGKTDSMTGPIMGPIFQQLVRDGHIEEKR